MSNDIYRRYVRREVSEGLLEGFGYFSAMMGVVIIIIVTVILILRLSYPADVPLELGVKALGVLT